MEVPWRGVELELHLPTYATATAMPDPSCTCHLRHSLQEGQLTLAFSRTEICNYPPLFGTCKLTLTRYYYNTLTFLCEPFMFSGCGGNRNNFKQKYICEKMCILKRYISLENPLFLPTTI
uniref:BPTI/Kunitz inhibitor domain-containing protein n=1 Tax=Sus scrofa TaxID=9823 RepID=A0A8W4FFV3_PIG